MICGYQRVLFQNENLASARTLMQCSFPIERRPCHRCILDTEYAAANKADRGSYSYAASWRKQVISILFFKEFLSFVFHQAIPSVVKYTDLKHTVQRVWTNNIYPCNLQASKIEDISSN